MTPEEVVFGQESAAHYEGWYRTPEGRRADGLEKASLSRLLEGLRGARSVLEVGAGTGHFARWLREQGLASVGLDLSAPMLVRAQDLDGVPLVRGDACHLPFADGAFDLVAMVTTLEFLECPREALAEALRVAREGLLLGVLNRWSAMGLQRRLKSLFRRTIHDTARFYSVRALKRVLRAVGGGAGHIVWHTTLFPRGWPCTRANLPWGAFIATAISCQSQRRGDDRGRHPNDLLG